jgi:hypothetical protein
MNGGIQMKNEKKDLMKKFNAVVEDLLDNYELYTDEEKAQIKEVFMKASELNTLLDKYDIKTQFDWNEYFAALGRCFDAMR